MFKLHYALAFVCAALVSASCAGVTTQTISFHSRALDAETTYIATLPSPLLQGHRYPVIYLLHGATGNYREWTEKTTVTQLLEGRDMILITPDGGPFGWYLDSKLKPGSQYDTAISRDLVADVDGRFPTIANRTGRGIAGLSMGGHGALSLAAKHPDIYGSASSMSGIVDITAHPGRWQLDDILGKQPDALPEWQRHSVLYLADNFTTADVALLFDTGTEDETGAVEDARKLNEALNDRHIWHIYHEYPGKHNWQYWSTHVAEHLDFHEKQFKQQKH